MKFDFTNVDDGGFLVLPPDRYVIETTEDWWMRRKEENDNIIIDVDVEITAGNYKGEVTRYFHTITDQDKTLGFLLRFLKNIGIIQDDDRDKKGNLKAEFIFGEKDDNNRVKIKAISINGKERKVAGYKSIATVTEYEYNGEKRTSIRQFEPITDEKVALASKSESKSKKSKDNFPF